MKYLGLALLLPLSANAQTASVFHFLVPNGAATASIGFRGAALGYEDKVPGGKILVLQYALLHGLTDWSGHAQDRDADLALLKEAGITVTPLAPEQRVILEDKLQSVRTKRNFGVPNAGNNRRPMSLQQMAEAHRALIAENAANIKYGAPGTGGDATRMTPAARERLLGELATELAALAAVPASDDAGWAKAVAAVNATAAQFGRKDAVIDAASPRAAASSAALAVYERERAAAAADATAEHRTLTLPQAAELRDKYGALFDGSAGPRPNLGLPTGPLNTGRREMSHNAQGPGSDLPVPSPEKSHGGGPGLFGMLGGLIGGLLKGLFRTAVRVAGAVVHGALGVAKALFS